MVKKFLLIWCLCMPWCLYGQKVKDVELNIMFIGNSITQGAQLKDPVQEARQELHRKSCRKFCRDVLQ